MAACYSIVKAPKFNGNFSYRKQIVRSLSVDQFDQIVRSCRIPFQIPNVPEHTIRDTNENPNSSASMINKSIVGNPLFLCWNQRGREDSPEELALSPRKRDARAAAPSSSARLLNE